jgi:hypothetical protein
MILGQEGAHRGGRAVRARISGAPFVKEVEEPEPLLGTLVTAAPLLKYCRVASSMSAWLGAAPAAASCII